MEEETRAGSGCADGSRQPSRTGRGPPAIPNPPAENERSPFEMDRPNQDAPGAGAPARRPAAPRANQPARPSEPVIPDLAPPGDAGNAPTPPRASRNEDQSDRAS